MTTINPVSVPANSETAFKGTKNHAKDLFAEAHKRAADSGYANIIMERLRGATEAMRRSPEELKETVMRETMLGNTDFVKGVNDVLAKNAAKDGYKPQ